MKTAVERVAKLKEFHTAARDLPTMDNFDVERIEEYINGLFSFAKFKVGDKVRMAKTYPVNEKDSWGWMHARHLLRQDQPATVVACDYYDGTFRYGITFDEKTYMDRDGKVHPTDDDGGQYWLSEKWLK
jgi:hypothetical protein